MIRIGDIDIADVILQLEYRVGVAERVMDHIFAYVPSSRISPEQLDKFRDETIKALQKKYPSMGIEPKKTEEK